MKRSALGNGVEGLRYLTSTSGNDGTSNIIVRGSAQPSLLDYLPADALIFDLEDAVAPEDMARVTADRLGKIFGQTFYIENKAGAGGAIGVVDEEHVVPELVDPGHERPEVSGGEPATVAASDVRSATVEDLQGSVEVVVFPKVVPHDEDAKVVG